jgi:uncharacterized protein (DUF488 family)
MKIFTAGFTRKPAEEFFTNLQQSGATRLVDVRLNNTSQLSAFAKRDDLRFFLKAICNMEYVHMLELAPTAEILDPYKKRQCTWETYEARFLELMKARRIESTISRESLNNACLLCSEEKPHHCHRRLVAEYLQMHWPDVIIKHLN